MGEARQRGTREQRVATAEPRPPRMGAEERRRVMSAALAQGLAIGLTEALTPILGGPRERDSSH